MKALNDLRIGSKILAIVCLMGLFAIAQGVIAVKSLNDYAATTKELSASRASPPWRRR